MDRVKKEDFEEPGPLDNVQKSSVLHDAQIFSEPHIQVNECYLILTKIMYLLVKGESFTTDEATKLFFGVTKLFQSQDPLLRRMVYLLIKELGKNQDNVFIVINCLSKDMTGSMELFQGNAIRVLSKVIDSTMLASMERFIKQAIVDRNSFVSSSALIAGEHLFNHSPEVVKRWSNEVQEALSSSSVMVQYHALALLYLMKKHDRLAATKVVAGLSKRPLKGALANVLLIRFVAKTLLSGQQSPEVERTLVDFLSSSLHHKNSMVAYEASKVLCTLPCISPQQISPAISVLQEFLNSAVVAQRFAAVRLLNSIVGKFPQLVTPCSVDLELLITDQNRNIATLAITTLLKTGVEASIDRLMKSITGFMNDVSDDLRKIVVDSIRSLSLKFPHKYASFLEFLATILREEGGFAYKRNIVETIMKMMKDIPESKEMGLECFCDFIEDCEFPLLSVQILDFLGEEAPKTLNPAKYIRYIFNRVILEQPRVRSAAVSALAKFAISCDSLADNVLVLMKRCLVDNDDEVRDRAVFYSELFDNQGKSAVSEIQTDLNVPIASLEYSLQRFLESDITRPFSISDVTVEPHLIQGLASDTKKTENPIMDFEEPLATAVNKDIENIKNIPEFKSLGDVYQSSRLIDVTESEAEYRVTCIKHMFIDHVLLQFNVTNFMDDQILTNIYVETDPNNLGWSEEMVVPIELLNPQDSGICYVCIRRPGDEYVSGLISATLKFNFRELDEDGDGVEDEYHLEDLEILATDYVKPGEDMSVQEFRALWEECGSDNEQVKRFGLSMNNLQSAVDTIIGSLNMRAIMESSRVPEGARSHTANLIGSFVDGEKILARTGFLQDATTNAITLKVASRASRMNLSQIVPNSIR